MGMTVQELISELQSCNPDAQVFLAHQPHWPLQAPVGLLVNGADLNAELDASDGSEYDEDIASRVYLGEGEGYDSSGYLPGVVAVELGWK